MAIGFNVPKKEQERSAKHQAKLEKRANKVHKAQEDNILASRRHRIGTRVGNALSLILPIMFLIFLLKVVLSIAIGAEYEFSILSLLESFSIFPSINISEILFAINDWPQWIQFIAKIFVPLFALIGNTLIFLVECLIFLFTV